MYTQPSFQLGAEGDVTLMRSGHGQLTIDSNVKLDGGLDVESLKIDGVPLVEYIADIVKSKSTL